MKKIIMLATALAFSTGCYIPYPSSGRRTLRPTESYEKICTVKTNKKGEKETRCRWVRMVAL